MKKIFAIILALCLCFSAAACAPAESTPSSAPASSGDPTTPVETVTLNVWAIESPSISDYESNGQSVWMNQETGINVNWMAVPQNGWYSAFQASVMGGEDVHIYCYPFDTMETEMLGTQMNYILPLEDLITPMLLC